LFIREEKMLRALTGFIAAAWMVIIAPGLLAGASAAPEQTTPPDSAAQKAAMARLDWMIGAWEGEGWTLAPGGQRWTFRQTEQVESRLKGAILVIEGRGFPPGALNEPLKPETIVFNAFAVISFDDRQGKYAFRSYAMGYANTFEAELTPNGAFIWRITPPSGPQMRYIMTNPSPDTWVEIGERSMDGGASWTQFFEMRLTRKG
jgi:hypothetical protein